jgi:hypothetical protein
MSSANETWGKDIRYGASSGGADGKAWYAVAGDWIATNWITLTIIAVLIVVLIAVSVYLGWINTKKKTSTMLVRTKKGYMPDPGIPARKLIEVSQNYQPQKSSYAKLKGADAIMRDSLK